MRLLMDRLLCFVPKPSNPLLQNKRDSHWVAIQPVRQTNFRLGREFQHGFYHTGMHLQYRVIRRHHHHDQSSLGCRRYLNHKAT